MHSKYKILIDFYKKNFHKVYTFYFHKLKQDISLAEDLTQNAFLKAFENLNTYDEQLLFSPWFWRLANNLLIDYYRKYKNEHLIALEILENTKDIAVQETVREELDRALSFERVLQALESLPEKKKDILTLYYISEIPINVIAEMYKTTTNNIRVYISRAISQLSHNLTHSHGQ